MKTVFVSSEISPYAKTGGLADVSGVLPKALNKYYGVDTVSFLPYYKCIKQNKEIECEFVMSFAVFLSWRLVHCGIFKVKNHNVFFIDNDYYFNRDNIYGYDDDGERFCYFSKAVLESLKNMKIVADIIHCNDWQTAILPVFLHEFYKEYFEKTKTVLTIHNIEYQGKCDKNFLSDVLGMNNEKFKDKMSFDGQINLLKGGILTCDGLNTVSKKYASELENPYYAYGLEKIISQHNFKIRGIVNGLDTDKFNPETDKDIFVNYGFGNVKYGKSQNKKRLREMLCLENSDVPLLGFVGRIAEHKGVDLILDSRNFLKESQIQLIILGVGDTEREEKLKELANESGNKIVYIPKFDEPLAQKIYSASDFFLMPSRFEPCGLSQLIAMRYGTVPIVHRVGGLSDTVIPFDITLETGVGFDFQSYCSEDFCDAVRRGLEIYEKDGEMFSKIVKNCMMTDFSWKNSSKEYYDFYLQLLG